MGGPGSGRKKGSRNSLANKAGASVGFKRQGIIAAREAANSFLSGTKKGSSFHDQIKTGSEKMIRGLAHDIKRIKATARTGKNFYNIKSSAELKKTGSRNDLGRYKRA